MLYSWNLQNYCTFKTFEVNRLKSRAYFVPYPSKEATNGISLLDYRYHSPKVKVLNGDWDFKFYPIPRDFPLEGDTDKIDWVKIDVPSCIQMRGYDIPYYTNVKYQFPTNPPHIPTLNPVGWYFGMNLSNPTNLHFELHNVKDCYNFVCVYRRFVEVDNVGKKDYTLRFYGVDPCYDLFINGKFVGYAEGSHEISDFDVNNYLVNGKNEIVVVVHRWCNGTYLEDQDMFRNNGIFRDVVLYEEEKTRVWDFDFKTERVKDTTYSFNLKLDVINGSKAKARVTLSYKGEEVYSLTQEVDKEFKGEVKAHEWNAEQPNLYTLEIELIQDDKVLEYIKKNVGFKKIEIKKDIFYFNNQKIKIKGVNHHDTHPKNGYTMTPQEIEKDIKICKEYGMNGIRTSHYPPDPLMIELCDVYGLYIIAEADIETHGMNPITSRSVSGRISNNLKWVNHFLDRAYRLYHPLKNNPCITMWSLGNESGGVACHLKMNEFFKSVSDIPVHLESAIHKKIVHYDVTSMMYPSIPLIHAVGSKTLKHNDHNDKMMEVPFFMCEYAHAMGVGPGCLEEYFDEVLKYDSLMGGCIWEFCDHAIYHKDGPYMYTYGGDHGEHFHDGNFCADGLFYPDRSPSSGARNCKYVYRPLKFKYLGDKKVEVFNTNNFLDASHYEVTFKIQKNNEIVLEKNVKLNVKPFEKQIVLIKELEPVGDTFLNIEYNQIDGNYYSFEQLEINQQLENVSFKDGKLAVEDKNDELTIKFNGGEVGFNKKTALLNKYVLDGVDILKGDTVHSLNRVKMDNDAYEALMWRFTGMHKLCDHFKLFSYHQDKDAVVVDAHSIVAKGLSHFIVADEYKVHGDGKVEVKSSLVAGKGNLPRFGMIYHFNDEFRDLAFYGRNNESYCDFHNHTQIGNYTGTVDTMMEPNLRPQESGNRCCTRHVTLSNGKIGLTFIAKNQPLEFAAKNMSEEDLYKCKHREDTKKYHDSYITIAKFNMGVGTGICGPVALPKYRYDASSHPVFEYVIAPKFDN